MKPGSYTTTPAQRTAQTTWKKKMLLCDMIPKSIWVPGVYEAEFEHFALLLRDGQEPDEAWDQAELEVELRANEQECEDE